jgi:O-acetylhomoserine (thiol)-lyase
MAAHESESGGAREGTPGLNGHDGPGAAEPGGITRDFGFETRAIHAGHRPDGATGATNVPLYQSSGFVFEDTESAAAYFNLQEYGNIYSRIMNPTVAAFEERIANLEGGAGAVAYASGMAAQMAVFFTLCRPGDHLVASQAIYGGTITQLKHTLAKLALDVTMVDPDDLDAWRAAIRPTTRAFFGETLGNPGGNVLDISAIAEIAHARGVPLVVDNTFASPYLCRPIAHGADIVVHSATKYIDGHGSSIGGVVIDSGQFDWSNGRFPAVAEPSAEYHGLAFHETFGVYGLLMKLRAETLRDLGAPLSPFHAFLYVLGLETLPVRMERHVANALGVARFLEGQPLVERVRYAGLPSSPYHALAERYLPRGAGGVFSFDLAGGREVGQRFIEALRLWSHVANVGDAKSLVIHPASTTHRQLSDEELAPTGVRPGTIRLSVGLETLDDLLWDLEHGLRAAERALGRQPAPAAPQRPAAVTDPSTEVTA